MPELSGKVNRREASRRLLRPVAPFFVLYFDYQMSQPTDHRFDGPCQPPVRYTDTDPDNDKNGAVRRRSVEPTGKFVRDTASQAENDGENGAENIHVHPLARSVYRIKRPQLIQPGP